MASGSPSPDPSLDGEWEEWKKKYEKKYSQDEEKHRRIVWEENKKKTEEHNAEYEQGKATFCIGLNEHSDLNSDELWETMSSASDSILKDQELLNIHLDDIFEFGIAFGDLTEDNNSTPEKDQPE